MVRQFRQLQLIKLFRQLELRQRLKRVLAEGAVSPDGLTAAETAVLTKYKHSESRVGQRLSGARFGLGYGGRGWFWNYLKLSQSLCAQS